jgi:hypothetical protein
MKSPGSSDCTPNNGQRSAALTLETIRQSSHPRQDDVSGFLLRGDDMGRRKKGDPRFESFLIHYSRVMDRAEFKDMMKYLYLQAQKHDVGFISVYDDGLYYSEWSDAKQCHVFWGLGYDLFNFCGYFGFKWPEHAEMMLAMLYAKDEDQVFKIATPDHCPPTQHWQFFRMARLGLGILTEDETKSARKVTNNMRARNVENGLTAEEIAARYEVTERTVRDAVKACWNYIDQGGRMKAAAAIGWTPYMLDRAIDNKNRKNKLR